MSYCASCTSVVPAHWYLVIRCPVISSGSFGLPCSSDGLNKAIIGLLCTLMRHSSCIFHRYLMYVDDAVVDYGMSSSVDSVVVVSGMVGNVVV